jgi:hypothetical protein
MFPMLEELTPAWWICIELDSPMFGHITMAGGWEMAYSLTYVP